MTFEFILSIILFYYLSKILKSKTELPQWNNIFIGGIIFSLMAMGLDIAIKKDYNIIQWTGHLLLFAIIYLLLLKKEFRPARFILYSALPLIITGLIIDITYYFNKSFFHQWGDYFDAIQIITFLWMIAMFMINKQQRKALAKEKEKTLQIENENKITEKIKAELEVQVVERTADLTLQKNELEHTLKELKSTQALLIQSEKMASLGELTAGIAHEIQNPLNFVNNFSDINIELLAEMKEEIDKGNFNEAKAIAKDISENEQKINHHGKRADGIVKGMLQHSRTSTGLKEPSDINILVDEYLRLSYHGLRAKDKTFNATMLSTYDDQIGKINIIPQDIGRVILNLFTNAFYTVAEKKRLHKDGYEPTVKVVTMKKGNHIIISVIDNGNGIPQHALAKIFQPFFTTKPTGEGTGLGLSLSYDIIKAHGGELKVETKEGEGTEFIITLPI